MRTTLRLIAVLFVCAGFFWGPVQAQTGTGCGTASLSATRDFRLDLGAFACVFADDSRQLDIAGLFANPDDPRFKPVAGGLVDFGFGSGRYWVRVRLGNMSDQPGTWWITHDIPVTETLHVRLIPEVGGTAAVREILSLTDRDGFAARPIPHRHLVSEVSLQPAEQAMLVIDYTSAQATEMPLFVETIPRFLARTQRETVTIVALIGLILGMGLISTVYLYGLDGRPAFAYGVYVLSGVVFLVHMEGYTFQFIWPGYPALNQAALAVIAPLSVAFGAFFVDRFTLSRRHQPRLHAAAIGMIVILVLQAVLSPFLIVSIWFKTTGLVVVIIGTLIQVFLALAAFRRGQSGAGFLVLGFGALAASISFGVLGYLTEGLFEQELAGRAIRLGFLLEALAFSAAIAMRVRAARRERDASLSEQIRLSEERLNLSEALRRAEDDRLQSVNAARHSQEVLASTAHDLRQPLASLQMALSSGETARDSVVSNLQYLDGIVRSALEENNSPLGIGDTDPPAENAPERFRADIVLQNIGAMFTDEAAAQGVVLHIIPCSAFVVADPLALMRIVGNLVSNALQHADPGRIVVGCRRMPAGLRFEVHDNGRGMAAQDLARIRQRGAKGSTSEGYGLGLSIVADLVDRGGLSFVIDSFPGRGTVASVSVIYGGAAIQIAHQTGGRS